MSKFKCLDCWFSWIWGFTILFGTYHIIFDLHRSKWWLIAAVVLMTLGSHTHEENPDGK